MARQPAKKISVEKKSPVKRKATTKRKPAKRGRPTKYTKQMANKVCALLAEGYSLRAIARLGEKYPSPSTVIDWNMNDVDGFSAQYEKARKMQAELLADEIFDIADDGRNDWMEREDPDNPGYDHNGESIQRSRLRSDARKWYLSKIVPRFKDARDLNINGTINHKHEDKTDEELEARIAELEREFGKNG